MRRATSCFPTKMHSALGTRCNHKSAWSRNSESIQSSPTQDQLKVGPESGSALLRLVNTGELVNIAFVKHRTCQHWFFLGGIDLGGVSLIRNGPASRKPWTVSVAAFGCACAVGLHIAAQRLHLTAPGATYGCSDAAFGCRGITFCCTRAVCGAARLDS